VSDFVYHTVTAPLRESRFRFLTPMPRLGGDGRKWAADLRRIEDLGFYSVTISEHYSQGWAMDALTAMNFALASTTRLRVMPLVLNNDMHHPAILAKAVATADVLSSGRVAVGLGAGWLEDDYRALGAGYDLASVRISRLEEALQVITAFFTGMPVTFNGKYYKLDGLEALPRPVQTPRPPIMVGGSGPKVLTVAAGYADIVSLQAKPKPAGFEQKEAGALSRASIGQRLSLIACAASRAGRRAPDIEFTCYDVNIGGVQVTSVQSWFPEYIETHSVEFGDSPVSLRGDVSKCVEDLRRWKDELGISYWHLGGDVDTIAPIVARLSAE
jgi:probable F420-dependent oxidoreductase